MKWIVALLVSLVFCGEMNLSAQQTVGLFQNSPDSWDGYTLFAPIGSTTSYLIDNCGELVQSWNSEYRPGQAVYFLENGILLRTGNTNNTTFIAGGTGGIIEMIDWDGVVVWDYTISSSEECQHHDVEYLPNGNILAVVWDSYSSAEAGQAGRSLVGNTLWSEKIVEIEPDLDNGEGTIVWEWKAWDHLIQDENPDKDNYGVVSDSPELIDLNFVLNNPTFSDWLHINSVDYHPDLDQVILSVHNFSEVWIIDHSTTTEEAAGHVGGICGKGGDLLYRWGNPQTYDQGEEDDQQFFLQHDAKWINEDYVDGGKIMVFNNQAGIPVNLDYSAINIIDPPIENDGNYSYSGVAFEPNGFSWTYEAPEPTDFFAENISGSERLPGGNTLICEGPSGRFFEVDYEGSLVWEYINPVSNIGIIQQGNPAVGNRVFRSERYARDYPGFDGQDLTPMGYIEPGSTFECDLFILGLENFNAEQELSVRFYPNPAFSEITVAANTIITKVYIFNSTGAKILEEHPGSKEASINVHYLLEGLYFVEVFTCNGTQLTRKFIKK